MTPKLYVKNIVTDLYNAIIGIETDAERIKKNLLLIFDSTDISLLVEATFMSKGEGIFLVHNIRQFVVRIQLSTDLKKWEMVLYDFKNDINSALDAYNDMTINQWEKITKDDFMNNFLEIQKHYDEIEFAELTLEDL